MLGRKRKTRTPVPKKTLQKLNISKKKMRKADYDARRYYINKGASITIKEINKK